MDEFYTYRNRFRVVSVYQWWKWQAILYLIIFMKTIRKYLPMFWVLNYYHRQVQQQVQHLILWIQLIMIRSLWIFLVNCSFFLLIKEYFLSNFSWSMSTNASTNWQQSISKEIFMRTNAFESNKTSTEYENTGLSSMIQSFEKNDSSIRQI